MKKIFSKLKYILVVVSGLYLSAVNILPIFAAQYSLKNVSYIEPYLRKAGIWGMITRDIGHTIFTFLAYCNDLVEGIFSEVSDFSLYQFQFFTDTLENVNLVVPVLLALTVTIMVLSRLVRLKENHTIIYNAIMTVVFMSLYVTGLPLFNELLGTSLDVVDGVVGKGEVVTKTTSQYIFESNTYDIIHMLSEGNEEPLSSYSTISNDIFPYIDYRNEEISRDILNEQFTIDGSTGEKDYEELDTSFFGFIKTHYYRFSIGYTTINLTLVASVIIYFLAIFKMAQLMFEFMMGQILVPLGLIKGVSDVENIFSVLKEFGQLALSVIILYLFTSMYPMVISSIMASNTMSVWTKVIMTFVGGMALIMGNNVMQNTFGLSKARIGGIAGLMAGRKLLQGGQKALSKADDMVMSGGVALANHLNNNDGNESNSDSQVDVEGEDNKPTVNQDVETDQEQSNAPNYDETLDTANDVTEDINNDNDLSGDIDNAPNLDDVNTNDNDINSASDNAPNLDDVNTSDNDINNASDNAPNLDDVSNHNNNSNDFNDTSNYDGSNNAYNDTSNAELNKTNRDTSRKDTSSEDSTVKDMFNNMINDDEDN